jgi:hypothetical protein
MDRRKMLAATCALPLVAFIPKTPEPKSEDWSFSGILEMNASTFAPKELQDEEFHFSIHKNKEEVILEVLPVVKLTSDGKVDGKWAEKILNGFAKELKETANTSWENIEKDENGSFGACRVLQAKKKCWASRPVKDRFPITGLPFEFAGGEMILIKSETTRFIMNHKMSVFDAIKNHILSVTVSYSLTPYHEDATESGVHHSWGAKKVT